MSYYVKRRFKFPDIDSLDLELDSISKQIEQLFTQAHNDINSNATNITTNATAIASKADKVGSDDIEITDSAKGLILNDGTDRWRITIDSTGTLITTKL